MQKRKFLKIQKSQRKWKPILVWLKSRFYKTNQKKCNCFINRFFSLKYLQLKDFSIVLILGPLSLGMCQVVEIIGSRHSSELATDICLLWFLSSLYLCVSLGFTRTRKASFSNMEDRGRLTSCPQWPRSLLLSFAFRSVLFFQKQPKCVFMYFWSLASSLRSFWPSGVCPLRQQTQLTQRAVN